MIDLDIVTEAADASPIDMLEHVFTQNEWSYERPSDEEIVATAKGGWSHYELRALWRDDERVLQFVAVTDMRVDEDKRGAIYELIGRINEQLWMGHFELWSGDGALLFRHATLIGDDPDDDGISADTAETIVETAMDECERFHPAFQFVLIGGKTPTEALELSLLDPQGEA